MDLRDIHYGYIVDIMEQDPWVIQEMCDLLDEIDMMMFVCDVDIAVCETLVDPIAELIGIVWKDKEK